MLFLLLLTGCAPSSIKDFSIPIYQDYISPINVPIRPEYQPVSVHFEYSTFMDSSITENFKTKKESSSFKMSGDTVISKLGELFVWDSNVKKMVIDRQSYAPSKALMTSKMLTDRYGNIQEFELSSPALESSSAAKEEIDKFKKSMRKNMKSFGGFLSENPVKTGDAIKQFNLDNFTDSIPQMSNESLVGDDIRWIVKGWGLLKEKKVIVASVDSELSFKLKLKADKINVQMRTYGYELYDPATFQILESKMLMVINTPKRKDNSFSAKILIQTSNRLK